MFLLDVEDDDDDQDDDDDDDEMNGKLCSRWFAVFKITIIYLQ